MSTTLRLWGSHGRFSDRFLSSPPAAPAGSAAKSDKPAAVRPATVGTVRRRKPLVD